MPKLSGNAIARAMNDVASVPTMAIKAPYLSLTGSHSIVVMNAGPNSLKAGHAPIINDTIMPAKTSKTLSAKVSVNL